MSKYLKSRSVGFYMNTLGMICEAAALLMYGSVLFQNGMVKTVLLISLAAYLIVNVIELLGVRCLLFRSVTIINAVLAVWALVKGAEPMVNQIGFVVAGLDPVSTIQGFIVFAIMCLAAMICCIIGSCLDYEKQEK